MAGAGVDVDVRVCDGGAVPTLQLRLPLTGAGLLATAALVHHHVGFHRVAAHAPQTQAQETEEGLLGASIDSLSSCVRYIS